MKPTKKPELLTIKKPIASQLPQEQLTQVDTVETSKPIIEQEPAVEAESQAKEYPRNHAQMQGYPLLQSTGNSGWQASDIWRELRVDGFCD